MEFIDCMNLAGAYSLAATQVGMSMKHCTTLEGFGVENKEANRHILGYDWEVDNSGDWADWRPQQAPVLLGTPPCSGFSLLNRNNTGKGNVRGPHSPINDCMWALIHYAAKCTGSDGLPGPEVVSFESVQQAGKQGRELMQLLTKALSEESGQSYVLTHVFMSGASVGAPQYRKRYFYVAHRIPFGIEGPLDELPFGGPGNRLHRVANYADAIHDLRGLESTWDDQTLKYDPTWWTAELRNESNTVDAHVELDNPYGQRCAAVADRGWQPGEWWGHALMRIIDEEGSLPEPWGRIDEMNLQRVMESGPVRIRPERPGYVITGGGGASFVHYEEPRLLTIRECARLMCFPDNWTWAAAKSVGQAYAWVGKQIPVKSGMFISGWIKRAVEGNPGTWTGEQIGENEFMVDCTNDYKAIYDDRSHTHRIDEKRLAEVEARIGGQKAA